MCGRDITCTNNASLSSSSFSQIIITIPHPSLPFSLLSYTSLLSLYLDWKLITVPYPSLLSSLLSYISLLFLYLDWKPKWILLKKNIRLGELRSKHSEISQILLQLLFWIEKEKEKKKDDNQNSTWLLHMFHKILRMLYLICIDVNLLSNNREQLRGIEKWK